MLSGSSQPGSKQSGDTRSGNTQPGSNQLASNQPISEQPVNGQPVSEQSINDKQPSTTHQSNVAGSAPATPGAVPTAEKKSVRTAPRTTLKLGDLLKVEPKKESGGTTAQVTGPEHTESFTLDALQRAWEEFAASKKQLQAEYHLLSQPFDLEGTRVTLHLLSPVQETMLAGFRSDLITFLRVKLKNDLIQVTGSIRQADEKKMIYTPRDKFEYLQEKIPILKEFKDRLGLDTDF